MLNFTDLLKRFTSRLLISFVITIWTCINYHETIDPWIFITLFGIFAIIYSTVKICSYYTGNINGEVNNINDIDEIIDKNNRFKTSEIRGS